MSDFKWPPLQYTLGDMSEEPDEATEAGTAPAPKRILILFSDDSTLFFACRMRAALEAAEEPCEIEMGWFLPESALSYRQLVQHLPQGADRMLTARDLTDLTKSAAFDAILTSRVYRPIGDMLKKPFFNYYAGRPCIVSFLGGLDFFPEKGFNNRRNCDGVYIFPRKSVEEFRTASEQWDAGWQEVGFGHPSFLMPLSPEPHRDPARQDIYFFAQAISPVTRKGRLHMLEVMAAIARRNPARNVWIKLRHLPHENDKHLHREEHDYPGLIEGALPDAPPNLKLTACTMDEALETAGLGITCTSTAAVDLIRAGVPTMIYLDFVEYYLDTLVEPMRGLFQDSGLITPLEQLLALDWAAPDPDWLDQMFCPRDLGTQVLGTISRFRARPIQTDRLY